MKIEMDENSAIASVVILLFALLAITIISGCHGSELTEREAIKAGLVQKQVEGSQSSIWTKP